jgi:putative inorganic carbon (hco3(-)) transporter
VPIRELALILIVLAICCTALFRPKIGLYGYIWFAIVQPDVIAWCEGKYPFSLGIAITTIIGSLPYLRNFVRSLGIPFVQGILLLQIPLGISILLCEGTFLSPDRYVNFERTTLMILFIPTLMETVEDMRRLVYTFVISEVMLGGRFGAFGLMGGGAMLNQNYGHLYDNNELALAIVMLIPICWQARAMMTRPWVRMVVLATVGLSSAAVILSNSRGGSLALGMIFLCVILRSRRKVAALVAVVLIIGPTIYLVQDRYFARMATIKSYEDEESAATRVQVWGAALKMWQDNPVFGVGFGNRNFAVRVGRYLNRPDLIIVAHNSYIQMLVDSGIFAFLIYCGLLFGAIFWLGRSARFWQVANPGWERIPIAFQTSLLGYAAGATFYSHQRYDLLYILVMTTAAWYQIQRNEAVPAPSDTAEQASEQTFVPVYN